MKKLKRVFLGLLVVATIVLCSLCMIACGGEEEPGTENTQPAYHSITYKNIKNAEYPMATTYAEDTGLLDLPEISTNGYTFLGWYTNSVGGEVVDYIPAGSTKDYVLFARWEIIEYAIHYVDAPITNNPDSYTVEDEITLNAPEWSGLSFAYWKDNNSVRTKIERGTTGEIVLTAHWRYKEELAVPNVKNRDIITAYDENDARFHFIYELGVIDDIVLETIVSSRKDYGQELSWSRTTSVTMQEDIAKTVSESIGTNVTRTQEFTNVTEWATSHSETKGWKNTLSLGVGIDIAGIIKPKIDNSFTTSDSITDESSWWQQTTTHSSETSNTQTENSYSSTVSYVNGTSKSLTETRNIPANMPTGTYTYAYVGTARVYIIISYDLETKDYYVDTYSILENNYNTAVLYELSSAGEEKTNIEANEPLNVDVPVEGIEVQINSSWYKVQYDANGGEGTMPISVFYGGLSHALSFNKFTREGYTFEGWATEPNGEVVYADEAEVKDLTTNKGEGVILYAKWVANDYTITFDANGGSVAETSRMVTFGAPYDSLPTPAKHGHIFQGWYNGNTKYESGTWTLAQDVTLTAKWELKLSFTETVNTNTVVETWAGGKSTDIKGYWYNYATWFDLETLKAQGYKYETIITYSLQAERGDPVQAYVSIGLGSGTTVDSSVSIVKEQNHDGNTLKDLTVKTFSLNNIGNASDLLGKKIFYIFKASTWQFLDVEDAYIIKSYTVSIRFFK